MAGGSAASSAPKADGEQDFQLLYHTVLGHWRRSDALWRRSHCEGVVVTRELRATEGAQRLALLARVLRRGAAAQQQSALHRWALAISRLGHHQQQQQQQSRLWAERSAVLEMEAQLAAAHEGLEVRASPTKPARLPRRPLRH